MLSWSIALEETINQRLLSTVHVIVQKSPNWRSNTTEVSDDTPHPILHNLVFKKIEERKLARMSGSEGDLSWVG